MGYLLGIDAGTTSLKAALFTPEGETLAGALCEYELITCAGADTAELDAAVYWESCRKVIAEVLAEAAVPAAEITACGVVSQGETLIPLDNGGNPLRPAIVWLDNRSGKQAAFLEQRFGSERVYQVTGQPEIVPTWTATKILWMKENEPAIFANVRRYLLVADYVIYKLTGRFATDPALHSSSLLLDINTRTWWPEMLEALGICEDQLPEIAEPGTPVGTVSLAAAKETGLSERTMVTTGAMDQVGGMIGAGNIAPGIVSETTGAALAICATVEKVTLDPRRRLPCQCHAVPGLYFLLPWCQTAGMALRWFRDEFCREEMRLARERGQDAYDLLSEQAQKVPPGSDGLVMLPHLAGAGSPEFDARARGVFFGFGLAHRKGHFVRALMESVAFMVRRNFEALEELGVEIGEVRALGGGARSSLWNGIKADVTGKVITPVKAEEATCQGAAIMAGVGAGVFSSIPEACERMVSLRESVLPRPGNQQAYAEAYDRYVALYEATRGMSASGG